MARKHLVLSILSLFLLLSLSYGCSADMTPSDPSIVWADDFEDGDTEGWDEYSSGKYFFVNEGVLFSVLTTSPYKRGDIGHESKVSVGTWSFDIFYPEEEIKYDICLSCDQDFKFGFGFYTVTMKNTIVALRNVSHGIVSPGEAANLGRSLTGWNHFDVTRDNSGYSKLYLNGELILEHKDELAFSPHWFYLGIKETGPALDNLVVRKQVIDIQPTETE